MGCGAVVRRAQRDHIGQVAAALTAQGVRCLYDAESRSGCGRRIWPRSCPHLRARGGGGRRLRRLCSRDWTRLERHTAFSQAVAAAAACVLPAWFDHRELSGLLPDVVAVDPRRYTPAQFADLVVAKLADLAISPAPSGEAGGGVQAEEADPRRLGVHAAISAALIPACLLAGSSTHNIAVCSLGRGMPLVEATAREPADAECLSAGRLGAVGAEVPAVDPIDPWQVPRPAGQGGPAAARTRRRPGLEAVPRSASALVADADPAGHAVAGPRSPAGWADPF